MDVLYRGEIFGGIPSEIKIYGLAAAALLHRYSQIEFVSCIEKDIEYDSERIYFFEIKRDWIEEITSLSWEEQRQAEEILKYYSVLTVSDDGNNLIQVRINHEIEQSIRNCPEYYIQQFDNA